MYKVAQYSDVIHSKDEDTYKRYELIRKLSQEFTVENKNARELDELLAEQLMLEEADELDDPTPTPQPQTPKPPKPAAPKAGYQPDTAALTAQFEQLFTLIKAQQPRFVQYDFGKVQSPVLTEPDIDVFQQILDDVIIGANVLLVGGAGTGKTYLAEQLVAGKALKRKHITINCSQWTSPTEIIGGQTMDGYVEGKLIEAWSSGWILVLDELPKIDPNTAGLLNDALAKTKMSKAVIFNARKESFIKHPEFACIATGNVYPNKESMAYGANNKQDLSLLDRFSGSVYFIEKNAKIEQSILQNKMVWSICDRLRDGIETLKYEAQLSLRFMQHARDSYELEMQRLAVGAQPKEVNVGKTLKAAFDSYLSTFTDVQRQNLKERMNYTTYLQHYQYRDLAKHIALF